MDAHTLIRQMQRTRWAERLNLPDFSRWIAMPMKKMPDTRGEMTSILALLRIEFVMMIMKKKAIMTKLIRRMSLDFCWIT